MFQDDSGSRKKEEDDHTESQTSNARRKLNKYVHFTVHKLAAVLS